MMHIHFLMKKGITILLKSALKCSSSDFLHMSQEWLWELFNFKYFFINLSRNYEDSRRFRTFSKAVSIKQNNMIKGDLNVSFESDVNGCLQLINFKAAFNLQQVVNAPTWGAHRLNNILITFLVEMRCLHLLDCRHIEITFENLVSP